MMKIEKITFSEAKAECSPKHWQKIQAHQQEGDEYVRYSQFDVYPGFTNGIKGIGLLRNGEIVLKVVTTVMN